MQAASAVLSLGLLTSTLVQPILAGVLLVPASPRDVFVLSKVRDSLAIFTATTSVSHSWDLEQAWTFTSTTDSLKLNTTELFLTATNQSGAGQLVLSSRPRSTRWTGRVGRRDSSGETACRVEHGSGQR